MALGVVITSGPQIGWLFLILSFSKVSSKCLARSTFFFLARSINSARKVTSQPSSCLFRLLGSARASFFFFFFQSFLMNKEVRVFSDPALIKNVSQTGFPIFVL